MFQLKFCVLLCVFTVFLRCNGQEYDFAAEIARQCLVPDPVGLLDCVENKVTLPYLTSWVECTNSLGQNVRTSADIINYRCKSVWEGKGVIPEVFFIKDCVIEKTGLPAKDVSAEVLGAYKECESGAPNTQQQRIKTAPIQQQQLRSPTVESRPVQSQTTQEYDFGAEIARQCLVPDPVGLLDCVENKVTLPYLTSWVECTNSLGQNVRTSADIINYRCKSVWEGKAVIPEVFYIKDCVIEKTGLPAKNVSAEVLGAYKECERGTPNTQQQRIKTAPIQQQRLQASTVEYNRPQSQVKVAVTQPPRQSVQVPAPLQPQNFAAQPFQSQIPVTIKSPIQQVFQAPAPSPVQQQVPIRNPSQFQIPISRPAPVMSQKQFFQAPIPRPAQPQYQQARPLQVTQQQVPAAFNQQYRSASSGLQYQAPVSRPFQPQAPIQQAQVRPLQVTQQQVPVTLNQQYRPVTYGTSYQAPVPQYPGTAQASLPQIQRQPYSQQYFAIYPQAPLTRQQQQMSQPILSQKTATSPSYISQQQIDASNPIGYANPVPTGPYMYSFQVNHPQRSIS